MTSPARPHKCPTCPAAFGSPAELNQHQRSHSAMASMTGGKYNGSAVRQHVPERAEALEMLGEGWPTPALRFVIRKFTLRDEACPECGTMEFLAVGTVDGDPRSKQCINRHTFTPPVREVRILQQLWHYGDEAKPVSRWTDVPTFEGEG